jgi:hypothetical protein
MSLRILIFTLLGWVIFPSAVQARCEGMVVLAAIHDAYLAAYAETGAQQNQGAIALLFLLGDQDIDQLLTRIERSGQEVSKPQLAAAVADAETLARHVLQTGTTPTNVEKDRAHVAWLDHLFRQSRCQNSVAATTKASRFGAGPGGYAGKPKQTNPETIGDHIRNLSDLTIVAIGLCLLICGYLGFRFWMSAAMRRARVERMPRNTISLAFSLTYTDVDGNIGEAEVAAKDISAGGMKLDWPGSPPQGTLVTMDLPIGTKLAEVAWANNYFAGVMLDSPFTLNELGALQSAGLENTQSA